MDSTPLIFTTYLRVRWSEVDMQKVVFNGHYLNYFDVAFTDYWRSLGLPTGEAQQASGHEMFAKKATVEYMSAAKFEDNLRITVHSTGLGRTSARFEINIWRDANPKLDLGPSSNTNINTKTTSNTDTDDHAAAQLGHSVVHIVRGELIYVYVETEQMNPVPWPQAWRILLAPPQLVCTRE